MKKRKAQLRIQVLKNQRFLVPESSRKAQLRIQEMAFMLVAVVLFFVLVGLFAMTIFYNNLHREATRIAEERTLSAITNLADSPEFSCVDSKSNCVDGDKLLALTASQSYKGFWTFSSLIIIKQRAFGKSEEDMKICTIQNYPDCDKYIVYDKEVEDERAVESFVALCRTENDKEYYTKCEIAKLVAGTEIINIEEP